MCAECSLVDCIEKVCSVFRDSRDLVNIEVNVWRNRATLLQL